MVCQTVNQILLVLFILFSENNSNSRSLEPGNCRLQNLHYAGHSLHWFNSLVKKSIPLKVSSFLFLSESCMGKILLNSSPHLSLQLSNSFDYFFGTSYNMLGNITASAQVVLPCFTCFNISSVALCTSFFWHYSPYSRHKFVTFSDELNSEMLLVISLSSPLSFVVLLVEP